MGPIRHYIRKLRWKQNGRIFSKLANWYNYLSSHQRDLPAMFENLPTRTACSHLPIQIQSKCLTSLEAKQ